MSYLKTGVSIFAAAIVLSLASAPIAGATTGTPYKWGNYVKAFFSTDTPGTTSADAHLQRWIGWTWQNLDSVSYRGGGQHATHLDWYCKGVGTYTYRLTSSWYNAYGDVVPYPIYSSQIRITC